MPTVSAVLGSVAGLPAINACLAHFNVMVKGISQIFPGGPPVVKAALGMEITKEELGGDHIHTRISGCIDNAAETEQDAFVQIRAVPVFLPPSVYEMAPRTVADDDPARAEEALLSLVPRDRRQAYDARKLIEPGGRPGLVLRDRAALRPRPHHRPGADRRLSGGDHGQQPAPQRRRRPTSAAGAKMMRLIQLCDMFHLPLISLADEPGFMVGLDSETAGDRARRRAAGGASCATAGCHGSPS